MRRILIAVSGVWTLCALAGVASADLLVNGDFSQGNNGFSSQYSYVVGNGTVFTQPGNYGVIQNPARAFTNPYASFGDHTTGSGLMLFADGTGAGTNVWSESVSVGPGAYSFTAWVVNGDSPTMNPAILALFVGGNEVGSPFAITAGGGEWQQWVTQLNFSTAAQMTFSIQDVNPAPRVAGNDYAIDDLSLTTPQVASTPEPGTLLLSASGFTVFAAMFRRRLFGRNTA